MGQGSDTDFPSTASMSFVFTAIFDGNVNVVGHVVGISGAAHGSYYHCCCSCGCGCFVLWQQLRDEVAITVILFLGQANYVVMGFGWSASAAATAAAHENRK